LLFPSNIMRKEDVVQTCSGKKINAAEKKTFHLIAYLACVHHRHGGDRGITKCKNHEAPWSRRFRLLRKGNIHEKQTPW